MDELQQLYYYITTEDKHIAALQQWGALKDDLPSERRRQILTAWRAYQKTQNSTALKEALQATTRT